MKKIFKIIALSFVMTIVLSFKTDCQELLAEVRVNTPTNPQTDPEVFRAMEVAIRDFLNNQTFTNIGYQPEERINCNFQITIREEVDNQNFGAELAIQATRPVYGSDYRTAILSYLDKDFSFSYTPSQPIQLNTDAYIDNLSSVLSFYAYMIIGYDYDSFEPMGGDDYFNIAQQIMNVIPPSEASALGGWQSIDGVRNRWWMIENVFNPRAAGLRQAWYGYHRRGLDIMFNNSEDGRNQILSALKNVQIVNAAYPNSMIVAMFAVSKGNEVLEIMAKAPRDMQRQTYGIMSVIDPANVGKYDKLK